MESDKWRISFSPQVAILWYSVIAGIFSASLIAFIVLYIETQERAHIDRVTQSVADGIKTLLEEDIHRRMVSLTEFSGVSAISNNMSDDEWELLSKSLYYSKQGYHSIGWLDSSFNVRRILPIEGNETSVDFDLAFQPLALLSELKSQQQKSAVITVPLNSLEGKLGLGIYVPVLKTTPSSRKIEGFIVGVILFDPYIKSVLPTYLIAEHKLTLFIDEQKVYSDQINQSYISNASNRQTSFEIMGQRWQVNLMPNSEFRPFTLFRMFSLLIVLGILLSFFITLAVYTLMSARNKTKLTKDDLKKTAQLLKNLPGMAYQAFNRTNRPMIFVSEGCKLLTGHSKKQFEKHNILWGKLIHPRDYQRVCQTINHALKTNRLFELEYRIITKNNDVRLIWERGEPVSSIVNDDFIIEGFITDITSIKQAEVDLLQSYAFSEAIVDSVVDAVITINNNGQIQSFNNTAQNMFGYSFDEVKDINVKILMPQPYSDHHDQYLAQYIVTNETHIIGNGRELVAKRKDGTTFPIHLSVSEIHNNEKKMFVGVIKDITQQRTLENEAISHIEQMAHADRLNALGEMAAGIAHEINQPLTAISLFSQTGKNFSEKGKFERLPEIFEKISLHARRAGSVLERVQLMTRQGDRSKEVIASTILIDEVKKLAESEARLCDISIQLLTCKENTNVFVDRVQIQQVILNLLRNGMEAMQSIACKNGALIKLQIRINAENNVEISVVDTGGGIPKTMIDTLFTPFSTTKKNGTGIGLSISKSIVEEHGGHIHFSDNKPAGAIFYFTLPIHEEGIPNDK
ncbi:MAG: two-component system sensor kinase FixL [Gammaproteobacteria bacterium]